MSENATAPTAGDTKSCKVCGETIKKMARVCGHCNNYQDWRRDLTFSGTVLSLLVALFSVLTVGLPVITGLMTPKDSNLSFSFQGVVSNRPATGLPKEMITVLAANNGIRPGTVREGMIEIYKEDNSFLWIKLYMPIVVGDVIIIEPGKSTLLNFAAKTMSDADEKTLEDAVHKPGSRCMFAITVTNFIGTVTSGTLDLNCGDIVDFVQSIPTS